MIVRIAGKLVEKNEQLLIIDVGGLFYEIIVPASVLHRIDETNDEEQMDEYQCYNETDYRIKDIC